MAKEEGILRIHFNGTKISALFFFLVLEKQFKRIKQNKQAKPSTAFSTWVEKIRRSKNAHNYTVVKIMTF